MQTGNISNSIRFDQTKIQTPPPSELNPSVKTLYYESNFRDSDQFSHSRGYIEPCEKENTRGRVSFELFRRHTKKLKLDENVA